MASNRAPVASSGAAFEPLCSSELVAFSPDVAELFGRPSRRQCLGAGLGLAVGFAAAGPGWAAPAGGTAPPVGTVSGDRLVLSNGVVSRTVRLPTKDIPYIATTDFRTVERPSRYFTGHDGKFKARPDEFAFSANGKAYSGKTGWELKDVCDASDSLEGRGKDVVLRSRDGGVEVVIQYLLYPSLPVLRKRVTITNLGTAPLRVENIDVESFDLEDFWPSTMSWIYSDYGRRKSLAPFVGGRQDALVALHNPDWGEGIVIGNEAAGVNKYTSAFKGGRVFRAGVARSDDEFPFAKWIDPGTSYSAPRTFSIVYADCPKFEDILNTAVPDFVRRHMGIRLSRLPVKPSFVYNTWEPFQTKIDEKMLMELATAAANAGVKEFVIDDGWQVGYGDWDVDPVKFPRGLRPLIEHVKALGMKPGIWVSIGSALPTSQVYKDHPEWFARDAAGKHYSVQHEEDQIRTACFGTGWRDYIKDVLMKIVETHGMEYLKLDFAIVSSAYTFDPVRSGCYAKDHPGHRDHAESLSVNFDIMWKVFDEIHEVHPEVFIDCTFEAMGGVQLIDYAMLQHAEGNWLSNYNEPNAENDLRVRNMAWWRSPAIPATALVIGNSKLNDDGFELHLKSLAGALPILLGDPRTMPPARLKRSRIFSDWISRIAKQHDIFSYRQDLRGFGEPSSGAWDGFQRINTESGTGGIVGVFRHQALEDTRRVIISGLQANARYDVRTMDGVAVLSASGHDLARTGFMWRLPNEIDGTLFEVTKRSAGS